MTAAALEQLVLAKLDDDKAEDVVSIDLADKSSVADRMIVASGRSHRHVGALADHVLRALKDAMVVARVAGITNRDAAAALTHVELYARRGQLPPPDADEFYYDDLVGLAAVTTEGAALGRVIAVTNYGAGDLLEVRPEAGGETLLFAFTKAVAVEIDFAGGRIVIDPPAEIEGEPEEA